MRIATLQFDPTLGEVESNIEKADMLLFCHKDRLENLDLLVLPELAFAGKLIYLRIPSIERTLPAILDLLLTHEKATITSRP